MVRSITVATILLCGGGIIPSSVAFSPLSATQQQTKERLPSHQIVHHSISNNNNDIDDFDPFVQSPHTFGDDDNDNVSSSSSSTTFGFLSYVEEESNIEIQTSIDGDGEFDPLLSPHAYANGVDEPPVITDGDGTNISNRPFVSRSRSSSTFGFLSYMNNEEQSSRIGIENTETSNSATEKYVDDDFDPLLSPHAYANGVDQPPVDIDSTTSKQQIQKQQKIGILLIDHGSKRKASNEHIHNIASLYESRLVAKQNHGGASGTSTATKIVRAAHMEIAPPSILDSLRSVIVNERVTKVICVPYFLSPGKHATEDVPKLIEDAKMILRKEGLLSINESEEDEDDGTCASILVSHALGTHMEGMLGAMDDLVEWTLDG